MPTWRCFFQLTQAKNKIKPAGRKAHNNPDLSASGCRTQMRKSGVHGKGIYAILPIKEGDTVLEYNGEIITWKKAQRIHTHDPNQPNHTFYFHLDYDRIIDARKTQNLKKG